MIKKLSKIKNIEYYILYTILAITAIYDGLMIYGLINYFWITSTWIGIQLIIMTNLSIHWLKTAATSKH
jgi:hypothetical protein